MKMPTVLELIDELIRFGDAFGDDTQVNPFWWRRLYGEKTGAPEEWGVALLDVARNNKIPAIKLAKAMRQKGLKDAKTLFDVSPSIVPFHTRGEAEDALVEFDAIGYSGILLVPAHITEK